AIAGGHAYDALVLDGEPAPTPAYVRELVTAGGGVPIVLVASGVEAGALAARIGASEVVARPLVPAELAFCLGRVAPEARGTREAQGARRPRKSDVLIGSGTW